MSELREGCVYVVSVDEEESESIKKQCHDALVNKATGPGEDAPTFIKESTIYSIELELTAISYSQSALHPFMLFNVCNSVCFNYRIYSTGRT